MSSAPSAAPTAVNVPLVSFSSIIVQWEEVDCIRRNGDITHYQVCYIILGYDSSERCMQSGRIVFNDSTPKICSIRVAAVNSAGLGPFSEPVTVEVDGKIQYVHTYIAKACFIILNTCMSDLKT